jgi:hypothetical protein
MKSGMLGVTALIKEGLIGLLAGENGYENVCLMVLAEVTTYTALTVMNCLHHKPPCSPVTFTSYDSPKGLAVVFTFEGT